MSGKKVNVLIYAGNGSTVESVRHATWSLRRLLGPTYAVVTVTADQIVNEPWTASCALLLMPGGADLAYCRALNGKGNRRIKQYVHMGGAYLGLCAGGYYGCSRCEFEVGNRGMEIVGYRELGFFPGTCRGLAFPGFVYHSEAGTRGAELKVQREALVAEVGAVPETFRTYYNGGGVFVDATSYKDVEVLASYTELLAVDSTEGAAAVIYCKVGQGGAILTGPHPEFSGLNLNRSEQSGHANYTQVVDALVADDKLRTVFMKACLRKLGLEVSQQTEAVPSLSRLHLSSVQPFAVAELVHSWQEAGIITKEDGEEYIKGENDTFHLEQIGSWSMGSISKAVKEVSPATAKEIVPAVSSSSDTSERCEEKQADEEADRFLDYNALTKRLVAHETALPNGKETPYFNHDAFFANLKIQNSKQRESEGAFGQTLMYGEVVTSTNTMLEKNPTWLSNLPIGFTATATTQVAGRGRGSNVWVSPPGSLMFSTVMRHSLSLSSTAPVVFIQYLAALAVVAGVHGYDRGYENLPVKLKWPNDVYALDPSRPGAEKAYVKIGGILVNSSYSGAEYTVIPGIGMNVNNPASPTTSLSLLAKKAGLPALTLEKLLASILAHFEALYTRFCRTGFDRQFEAQYYACWLHSDQIVTLETEGGARARIKGITRDWGLLVAEELGWQDRATGKRVELQSDSNSFDFFKGLLRRKV